MLEKVIPLQVTHGGPILMMQIENEYGSYGEDLFVSLIDGENQLDILVENMSRVNYGHKLLAET